MAENNKGSHKSLPGDDVDAAKFDEQKQRLARSCRRLTKFSAYNLMKRIFQRRSVRGPAASGVENAAGAS